MLLNEEAFIVKQEKTADNVFSTVMRSGAAAYASPGQFVMVGSHSDSHLLKRPISICAADPEKGLVRLVYRTVGFGTRELSLGKEGESFSLLGPLGNGFPPDAAEGKKNILLIGGGIGAPPLLFLARGLRFKGIGKDSITAVLGYRSEAAGLFLTDEFKEEGQLIIATDDGSAGTKGTVMDAVKENGLAPDLIYACGPLPMLKAVKAFAADRKIPAYISLEERMACGVGACLGCVTRSVDKDSHSGVRNKRVCTEGPVFDAYEVEI